MAPVSKRRSSRPIPGQPLAKFEKSRCTISHQRLRNCREELQARNGDVHIPHLGYSKLEDAALDRNGDGVCAVIRLKLGEDIGNVAFDSLVGDAKFVCNLLVRVAVRYQSERVDL